MSSLTVLTDDDVRSILHSLTRSDVVDLQSSLAEALHTYSTGTQDDTACSLNQPKRIAIPANSGSKTTLFMPANAGREVGMGVKIVTLGEGNSSRSVTATPSGTLTGGRTGGNSTTPKGSLTLLDNDGTPTAILNAEELTAFRTALATTM